MAKRYNTTTSFLDVLFNTLLSIFMLFILTLVLVNPPKQTQITLNEAMLITVSWDEGSDDDVDTWLLTPASKSPINFRIRENRIASLDRDDRGLDADTFVSIDGKRHQIQQNIEHVTIRKLIPGHYVLNVVMFSKRDKTPTRVKIKVERLQPYQIIFAKTITMYAHGEEITVIQFDVSSTGEVENIITIPYNLIRRVR